MKNGIYRVSEIKEDGVSYKSYKNRKGTRKVYVSNDKVYAEHGEKLHNEISPKVINEDGHVRFKFRKRHKNENTQNK